MRENGFTIIEMMIVITVIAIVTTVVLVEYRSNEKTNLLQLTAQQAVNDIREAQNMSLSSQKSNGEVPLGGFGVSFSMYYPDSYIVFADENANHVYDGGEEVRTVNLPGGVKLTSTGGLVPLDITFLPPDPTTYFTGAEAFVWSLDLGLEGTDITKTINIYDKGVVEIGS